MCIDPASKDLPNDTTQGRQNGKSSVHSLSVYNTVVIPRSKAVLASGPGPFTSQPMSPGPQLLEYIVRDYSALIDFRLIFCDK